MTASGRTFALVCAVAMVCSCLMPFSARGDEREDPPFFVSVDETKVSVVSGNLTIAVTREWPRMVFHHTVDPFSPTFDVGFPKLHLFNDTDGDGRFCRSEAEYTVYLDSNHVRWNLSSVEVGYTPDFGEFVVFSMTTVADAYNETIDAPPSIESWANLTFWFRLTENGYDYENPAGTHTVAGRTEMFVNMTLDVINETGFEFVALERLLQGGATTDMFHILEDGPEGPVSAVLWARENEESMDDNFTRPLNSTASPTQSVDFAKDDGTVQAFYHWGSSVIDTRHGSCIRAVNSSCLTTGTGMLLHSALPLTNGTIAFALDSSLGIDEEGFVGGVTEWVKEQLDLVLVIAVAALAVAVVTALHVALRRRRLRRERSKDGGSREED